MTKELNDKLENIAIHSAWTFDEAFQLLTGKTLFEVESLLSKSPPPSNDLKWVLMRKTKTIETRPGYSIHFKKGEIVPTEDTSPSMPDSLLSPLTVQWIFLLFVLISLKEARWMLKTVLL